MALIKCKGCGGSISQRAAACPTCGHPNEKAKHLSGGSVFFALAVVGAFVWWKAGGGFDAHVANEVGKIEKQVANDQVQQYNIAKRQGDAMQVCVQAGVVSAAFLQAKDEANYQTWKKVEMSDCKRAGIKK